MRACAAVVALLIAAPLFPQCNQTPVLSVPFRLSTLDVTVDGNDLWTATSYGVALYDRTFDPPQLTASVALPGTTRIVRPSNGYVYAGSGNALIVLRKDGLSIDMLHAVDAGAPINDIAVTTLSLFVATQKGIAQYSLSDPSNPSRTMAAFVTSLPAVSSLALLGTALYAADGDSSIASWDLTTLQPLTALTGPPNTIALHTLNGKLLASSLLQTTLFLGTVNLTTIPNSIGSLAPVAGDTIFFASGDRTLHAIDLSTPGNPIDLFHDDLPATLGTVNRINALASASGRLYAAAGDIGLVSYDISGVPPFPMRGEPFSGASSIFMTAIPAGDRLYAGTSAGVTEFDANSLIQGRTWDGSNSDTVWDGHDGLLLTSSGASMTMWTLTSSIPQPVATTTFPYAVNGAVLIGTTAYAVLANRSLETADFSQQTPIPQPLLVPVNPSSIARSGNAIALADARADGTTMIAYFASLPPAAPQIVTLPGLAASPVTLSGTAAAVQTYQGISIVDFGAGTTTLLPSSNDLVARQIFISGPNLLELTASTLRVWSTQARVRIADVVLPSMPSAVYIADGTTTAFVATATDVVTVALDKLAQTPFRDLPPSGNAYYKKVVATSQRIDLFGPAGVDLFTTAMQYRGSIRSTGVVDFAADDSGVFTVHSDMSMNAWTPEGSLAGSVQINEGSDAQPLSIVSVNGAVWVSLIHGCTSGACDKKTLAFRRTAQTTSMTGGIIDLVTNGNRAYAITDIPSELRVIDISDPLHPSIIASTPVQSPLAVAYSAGTIFVLGNTLTPYAENGLIKGADILGAYTTDGTVTLADQHLRIDGGCATMTGRTFAPQQFALPQWTPSTSFATPSTARFLTVQPGTFYVLTDDSLEIWSGAPLPKALRRRPAR